MPIIEMHMKNGVFWAQEVGIITPEDAEHWAATLAECARRSAQPVAALVDARRATLVTPGARRILVEAYRLPNLKTVVVCANNPIIASAARIIGLLGKADHTIIFDDLDEAWQYAEMQVNSAANC